MVSRLKAIGGWIWLNTDPVTKWLQVLAVLITAGWVLFRYNRGEAPSLEMHSSVTSDLNWTLRAAPSTSFCEVTYTVTVKNEGITSFDVEKTHIQVWRNELPKAMLAKPVFLDFRELQNGISVIDIWPPTSLNRHFSPQYSIWQGFEWLWPGKPEVGLYVFQVVLEDRHGNRLGLAQRATDQLCIGSP